MTLQPGNLFAGRYEIVRLIGEGGMGAVYHACDPKDKSFQVALKVLFPSVFNNPKSRARFSSEMKMCEQVTHENVVRSYEHFDLPSMLAFAMEYVDGGDLASLMRLSTLSIDQIVDYVKQAARGLAAIHAAGIVHRDLKPENMLLTRKKVLKISDFGLARSEQSGTLTNIGALVGTPQYVSPEYIELGECDRRADIFALGVITYEMISGKSPWGEESGIAGLAKRNFKKFPDLQQVAPHCSSHLATVVARCMAHNLTVRYQSAEELLQDLSDIT
jgi:serine/threonine protein kinase